jgi:glycine dehydrogenase subunit 1
MRYIPHTERDVAEMLEAVGVPALADLFADVPAGLRERASVALAPGLSEPDVRARLEELARLDSGADLLSFLGAGAYRHFSPAVVDSIVQRAEFYSSYTPYQPEVSQGTLQAIFEFQTLVAMLFGLEVANASMYDGASACAEAALMALRLKPKRPRIILARSLHPDYRAVTATYLQGVGDVELLEAPFAADGRLDLAWLAGKAGDATAAVVVGYPNFFGVIEDLAAVRRTIDAGAALVSATPEPLALGILRAPGDCGVEIAVGEGQSLGIPLSYGGPGVGLFATLGRHVRSMPGRLVGEASDGEGRRGYVLTLATREQHIRRERATSNICTNHGLMALAVTVYLSLLGKVGLRRLALTNLRRAYQAQSRLSAGGRWRRRFSAPFFNEFVVSAKGAPAAVEEAKQAGVLAGVCLGRWYPEMEDDVLLAVTEVHDDAALERLAAAMRA